MFSRPSISPWKQRNDLQYGEKNIQAKAYNGARTVDKKKLVDVATIIVTLLSDLMKMTILDQEIYIWGIFEWQNSALSEHVKVHIFWEKDTKIWKISQFSLEVSN
jgi:hypothetical protein